MAKSTETFKETDIPLGDRINLCYSSTIVTQGRGSGIVVATGMSAQIGRIADAMNSKNNKDDKSGMSFFGRVKDTILNYSGVRTGTPLQRKLTKLAYVLFLCAFILAMVVFAVAKFQITEEVTIYVCFRSSCQAYVFIFMTRLLLLLLESYQNLSSSCSLSQCRWARAAWQNRTSLFASWTR